MTATTMSPVASAQKVAVLRESPRRYALFALWASLYILPFMRVYLIGTDEGTLDYGAVRVLHGQVFARDFFEVIGPGTFYWLAGFFKAFGISFLTTRICLFLTSLGTALLMYFLSRRICKSNHLIPSLLLAASYFGGLWPAISHHVDSNFFALLTVACTVWWQDTGSDSLLFAAGVLAGLTTAFLQPKGMLLFLSILVWLWIQQRRQAVSPSSLGVTAAGYVGTLGLILMYFRSKGALGSLMYVNFVWPSRHYGAVNAVPYAQGLLTNYWDHWVIHQAAFRWTVPMAAILIVPVLFIVVLPGLLVALSAGRRRYLFTPEIQLYWLCGSALWFAEIHRKNVAHLAFGSPLLIILCIYFLTTYRGTPARLALRVLSVSAICLATFNLLCVLLATHTVTTRAGRVWMFKDESQTFTFLADHVRPGEEVFAYPYSPRYYFLSSAENPTPYSILVYNYNTRSQFQEAVEILNTHKVKYVLWDGAFASSTTNIFPTANQIPAGGLIIEPYLKAHYRTVQDVDGLRILERQGDE